MTIQKTPWGQWEVLIESEYFKVKRIVVNPGHRTSEQKHARRTEHWVVEKGKPTIMLENKSKVYHKGDSLVIQKSALHRLENKFSEPCCIIEIQQGEYLGEDDIIRTDDDYGRQT